MEQKLNLIYSKMKKQLTIFLLLLVVACTPDESIISIDTPDVVVPESLAIDELIGLRLESSIVTQEVRMNVKLPHDGTYRIKIRHGLNGELISQEKIQGKEGDNILKVYVNALDNSSYKLDLTTEQHELLGVTAFSKF